MEITHTVGTYTKSIDAQARLEQVTDSQVQGDAPDKRQHRQAPEQILITLENLAKRQQDSADAAKAFARNGTPQQLQNVFDSAVAVRHQNHLLEAGLREFAVLGFIDTRAAHKFPGDTLAQLRTLEAPAPLTQEILSQASSSPAFFDQLLAMIGLIRQEYLAVYEVLLEKYSDFYKEFNKNIMSRMGDWIQGVKDGKEVRIDGGLYNEIRDLFKKYSAAPAGMLFPIYNKELGGYLPATKDDALKWAEAMGMGENSPNVKEDPVYGWCIMMDLSPLKAMQDALPSKIVGSKPIVYVGVDTTWDSAKFQAWQTGFNSQEGDMKNQLQMFTTKYGNANSYHENFNKILSSQLSQYAEMLKAIVSGIA